jgi:hypothetical protein
MLLLLAAGGSSGPSQPTESTTGIAAIQAVIILSGSR